MWEKIKTYFKKPIVSNYRVIDNVIIVSVLHRGITFNVFMTPTISKDEDILYYRYNTYLEDGTNLFWDEKITNAVWDFVRDIHRSRENENRKITLTNIVE